MTSSLVGSEMCIRDRPGRRISRVGAWKAPHVQDNLCGVLQVCGTVQAPFTSSGERRRGARRSQLRDNRRCKW
eukprot:2827110-Prorocentrum_lima.AAC.1